MAVPNGKAFLYKPTRDLAISFAASLMGKFHSDVSKALLFILILYDVLMSRILWATSWMKYFFSIFVSRQSRPCSISANFISFLPMHIHVPNILNYFIIIKLISICSEYHLIYGYIFLFRNIYNPLSGTIFHVTT